VVVVPPIVTATVGGVRTGVQLPCGVSLVSKLSKLDCLAGGGGFSVRMTLWSAGTVKLPQMLLYNFPPLLPDRTLTETLVTVMGLPVGLSSRMAPAS
jgi:hypothetical protein